MKSIATQVLCLSILLSVPTFAQDKKPSGPPTPPAGEHRQGPPPPEALDACKDKKENDACSFKGRNSENVEGTCFHPEASAPLGCKPSHGPDDHKQDKKKEKKK